VLGNLVGAVRVAQQLAHQSPRTGATPGSRRHLRGNAGARVCPVQAALALIKLVSPRRYRDPDYFAAVADEL